MIAFPQCIKMIEGPIGRTGVDIAEKVAAAEQAQVHGSQQQQARNGVDSANDQTPDSTNGSAGRVDWGTLRKKAIDHHEQVTKYSELQSTRMELVNNSLSAQ